MEEFVSVDSPFENAFLIMAHNLFVSIRAAYYQIPGSAIMYNYVKNSYQNDPFRVFLETLLVIFTIKYVMQKRYSRKNKLIKLTEKEVDELVSEWEPEPLVSKLSEIDSLNLNSTRTIKGRAGTFPETESGKMVNFSGLNFVGFAENPLIKDLAVETLKKYGVGTCGPRGFYGTLDVHLELEKNVAKFVGMEEAIIYSQGFSTISSVIPAFCKRGDIIVCDEGCSFAIQTGAQISRSKVFTFKHNDMKDLEKVLSGIGKAKAKNLTRRFIVTEGIFYNYGDICPLPEIVALKNRYKYRLILEESLSFGTIGSRGAGVTDYFGVASNEIDAIVASFANAAAAAGGFCAGSHHLVDHQRLSGQAYCFSASMPAIYTVAANMFVTKFDIAAEVRILERKTLLFRQEWKRQNSKFAIGGSEGSPIIHLYRKSMVSTMEEVLEEDKVLQSIVEYASERGILLSRCKYIQSQEYPAIVRPSIRLCITSNMKESTISKAAIIISEATAATIC